LHRYGAEALLHHTFSNHFVNIGGLKFINEAREALGNSCKAKDEYSSFISIIQQVEDALHQIQELQLEHISPESIQEYKANAVNTQQVVDNFRQRIVKRFDGSLAANPVQFEKKLRTAFSKMEWTSIKSLLEEFKSSLNLQIGIQNMLALTMILYAGISYMCLIIISFEGMLSVAVSQEYVRHGSTSPSPRPRCIAVRLVCFTNILSRLVVKV